MKISGAQQLSVFCSSRWPQFSSQSPQWATHKSLQLQLWGSDSLYGLCTCVCEISSLLKTGTFHPGLWCSTMCAKSSHPVQAATIADTCCCKHLEASPVFIWVGILASHCIYVIFFPSLIIFSASYITSLLLGFWPQGRREHTLLLILGGW